MPINWSISFFKIKRSIRYELWLLAKLVPARTRLGLDSCSLHTTPSKASYTSCTRTENLIYRAKHEFIPQILRIYWIVIHMNANLLEIGCSPWLGQPSSRLEMWEDPNNFLNPQHNVETILFRLERLSTVPEKIKFPTLRPWAGRWRRLCFSPCILPMSRRSSFPCSHEIDKAPLIGWAKMTLRVRVPSIFLICLSSRFCLKMCGGSGNPWRPLFCVQLTSGEKFRSKISCHVIQRRVTFFVYIPYIYSQVHESLNFSDGWFLCMYIHKRRKISLAGNNKIWATRLYLHRSE